MGALARLNTVVGRGRMMASSGTSSHARNSQVWIDPHTGFAIPGGAGFMTPEVALTLSHVYSACGHHQRDFGTMTCQLFRNNGAGQGKSRVASSDAGIGKLAFMLRWQPNSWQTAKAFWSTLMWQYQLRPACYAEIIYRPGSDSYIDELIPRHPDRVQQERLPSGRLRFKMLYEPSGRPRYVTQDEMFVVRNTSTDGLNALSRVAYGTKDLATGIALQEFTRNYFEHGATAALMATYKGGTMEPEQEAAFHARISRFMSGVENAGGIFVSDEDMSISNVGVEPEKAQLLGLKNINGRDVARRYKMPASWLQIEGAQSYGSAVQDSLWYAQRNQMPNAVEFEQAIQRDLIVAQNDQFFAKFNMDVITRATLKERMEAYEIGIRARVIRPSEARELEDRDPDPELDELSALDHRAGSQRDGADNKPKSLQVQTPAADVRLMLIVHDTAARVVRQERDRVEKIAAKHANDVDGWKRELKAFYVDHASVIAERLRLPIATARALAAKQGQAVEDTGVVLFDEHWERHAAESLTALALEPSTAFERLADATAA